MNGTITITTNSGEPLERWSFANEIAYYKALGYVQKYHGGRRIEILFKSKV